MSEVSGRISKLEGQQEGLKQSQVILIASITMVSAILIAIGIYAIQKTEDLNKSIDSKAATISAKVDDLSHKFDALPGKIGAEVRDVTQTLSTAITATKQQSPPPVIVIPAPGQPQSSGQSRP